MNDQIYTPLSGEQVPANSPETQRGFAPEQVQPVEVSSVPVEKISPQAEVLSHEVVGLPGNENNITAPMPAVSEAARPAPVDELDDSEKKPEEPWVEAVETIIEQNQGHPFEEEIASEKLGADYLKKKFGKEIGIEEN